MKNDLLELKSTTVSLLHDEPIEDHDLVDIQNRLNDKEENEQKISLEEKKRQAMLDSRETILDIIFLVVCRSFNIPREVISIDRRKRNIVEPRQIISSFAYKYLNQQFIYPYYAYSMRIIGNKVGGREHATVLHSIKTVNNQIDIDKNFRIRYFDIDNSIIINMKINDVFQYIK